MEASTLNISNSKPPLNSEESLPFLIVGDEAFPLNQYLLRPYPGVSARNDESKQIYNYRLTRARRVVENAFGVLTQKFRLFYGRIQLSPENADKVVLAELNVFLTVHHELTTYSKTCLKRTPYIPETWTNGK